MEKCINIEEILDNYKGEKKELISLLQAIQDKFGYLSEESIKQISKFLNISENEIYGVATFYAQFRFQRPAKHAIKVCLGTACHVKGGEIILETFERELNIKVGEVTKDGKFSLERVACVGCCALAPVVIVDDKVYAKETSSNVKNIIDKYKGNHKK